MMKLPSYLHYRVPVGQYCNSELQQKALLILHGCFTIVNHHPTGVPYS